MTKSIRPFSYVPAILLLLANMSTMAGIVYGQNDWPVVKAPPNQAVLSKTINGWYFVPKEFKQNYETTLSRLEALQANVDEGHLSAVEAQAELADLKQRLATLRNNIEASRVHVAGATIQEQTEAIEFELGPEQRLAITSNHVHVVGWDGPQVKCELKKMVLAPDDKPVDEHLKAIKIVHQHGRAEFAGKTQAESDADEQEYLAKEGAKFTDSQRANRRKLLDEIQQSRAIHRDYVAKEIDLLTVAGLEYENNKCITLGATFEGGEEQRSVRQRYAELTVYVPPCAGVCVRGARRALVVENLAASLTIVDEDSTDSDQRGRFEVHGLKGNLVSRDFPLQTVTNVTGHVTIEATQEFGVEGAGMSYFDNLRDLTPARPIAVQVHQVSGGVDLRFGRVRLDLQDIQGKLNVSNEFGDTRLLATERFAATAHRIISQSGRIDIELSADAWSSIPVVAVTNHGGLRTNIPREEFDDFHLEGQDKHDGSRRSWMGFRTVVKDEDRFAVFRLLERFPLALEDAERPAGLDLLSRNGSIGIMRK
jgi:hypothetical protein